MALDWIGPRVGSSKQVSRQANPTGSSARARRRAGLAHIEVGLGIAQRARPADMSIFM